MKKLLISIDAGGSSTKGKSFDENMKELSSIDLEVSYTRNANFAVNANEALKNIKLTIKDLSENRRKLYILIFAAGINTLSDKIIANFKIQIKSQIDNISEIEFITDAKAPIYLGSNKKNNKIAITAGTGLGGYIKSENRDEVILGYGHMIGEWGSSFEYGRELLFQALTLKNSELTKKCLDIIGVQKEKLIEYLYFNKNVNAKSKIASLAVLINDLSLSDVIDPINVENITKLSNALKKEIPQGEIEFILMGGMFKSSKYLNEFKKKILILNPRATFLVPSYDNLFAINNFAIEKKWIS